MQEIYYIGLDHHLEKFYWFDWLKCHTYETKWDRTPTEKGPRADILGVKARAENEKCKQIVIKLCLNKNKFLSSSLIMTDVVKSALRHPVKRGSLHCGQMTFPRISRNQMSIPPDLLWRKRIVRDPQLTNMHWLHSCQA